MDTAVWPPPRRVHAEIIRGLNRLRVSTIVMDVWFERARMPEDDEELARAMAERGNVVLVQRVDSANVPGAGVRTQLIQSPLVLFQRSAISLAPFPLPRTSLTSFFWPFFETAAGSVPTLPAAALQIHGRRLLTPLKTLLEQSGAPDLHQLPSTLGSVDDSSDLMRALRRQLSDRAIAERAQARLSATSIALAADDRALLTALVNMYAGPNMYYLNFYGPPGRIPTIPFHELISGSATPPNLEGAVVFVGTTPSALLTSAEQIDTYATVYSTFDGVNLSGVEIGATAFANLLAGQTLTSLTAPAATITIFVFGAAAGFLARVLPSLRATAALLLMGVLSAWIAQYAFAAQLRLVPLAIPLLVQLPLALVTGLLLRYRDIRRQVPIEVDPDAPQELFDGICMTADVRGYTALAERLSPDELHILLDDYYVMVKEVVEARRGLVWGRGGDSALAVWRATNDERRAHEARLNACGAAIDLRDAIERFNRGHRAAEQIQACIGLDAGPIGLGPVAGELQAVGNAPNTASRIEALNRVLGTRVLASHAIVRDQDSFAVRRLGRFRLRGRSDAVDIVELLGHRHALTEEVRRLAERFSACLELFDGANWADAYDSFRRLSADYPADGPAAYYRDLSARYAASPPPGNDAVIRVDTK
jgi:adenylate cyclase